MKSIKKLISSDCHHHQDCLQAKYTANDKNNQRAGGLRWRMEASQTKTTMRTPAATPNVAAATPPTPPTTTTTTRPASRSLYSISAICSLVIILLSGIASGVVVHQVRFIESKTGRIDYALTGETIELSCHYMMKDEAEDIKQLVWSKDGKNFLKWRKNRIGLEVLSYTFKGHIDQSSINSHLIIHNVTIDMHGKYKCSVKTDLGVHEMEHDLIVISSSGCKLNDWRIISEQPKCRETFKLDCRNMFPKPVPSCGLWNDKLDKFIRSVVMDISEEPNKETYRVKYFDRFELQQQENFDNDTNIKNPFYSSDLLQYAGHLMFKCDIVVPDTSWKLSLVHKMFDYSDGCHLDPLETIETMRSNYSHYATTRMQQAGYLLDRQAEDIEMLASSLKYELIPARVKGKAARQKLQLNCWQKPRIGSLARLSCANKSNQVKLIGTNLLECKQNGWVPVMESSLNNNYIGKYNAVKKGGSRRPSRSGGGGDGGGGPVGHLSALSKVDLKQVDDNGHKEELSTQTSVVSLNQSNSNDLDHKANGNDNDNAAADDDDDSNDNDDSANNLPTTVELENANIPTSQDILAIGHNYSPARLASLLPTCVATNPRRHKQPTTNRLPLLDGTSGEHETREDQRRSSFQMDSSSSKIRHSSSGHDWSIFGSSSSGSAYAINNNQRSLALTAALIISVITFNLLMLDL